MRIIYFNINEINKHLYLFQADIFWLVDKHFKEYGKSYTTVKNNEHLIILNRYWFNIMETFEIDDAIKIDLINVLIKETKIYYELILNEITESLQKGYIYVGYKISLANKKGIILMEDKK